MRKQKDRVIIDANIWISFLLAKDFPKFDTIIADQKLILVFSEELIHEIIEVTQRSKFRKYFALQDVEGLLIKIKDHSIFIDATTPVTVCRDAKDNFLLSLAVDAGATHLITGDKDLLSLKKFGDTDILTISQYLEISIQQ